MIFRKKTTAPDTSETVILARKDYDEMMEALQGERREAAAQKGQYERAERRLELEHDRAMAKVGELLSKLDWIRTKSPPPGLGNIMQPQKGETE
ncbi:hypothetical protein [Oceanidesulfovibrio marinus]|uniref:Uncharacterized protein n=1 Tax=Oceanidesulfovibrio marinus TaxID=370038 RepID=A0A6P1ZBA5_9BACT|nr:hypothetical protein [Oceanidesulfovibrio marinus]TVM31213.1 hypothetical protein DQK91_19070 [Oceanidesulfovibrio marinus]